LPSLPTKSRRLDPPARIAARSVTLMAPTSLRLASAESPLAGMRGWMPARNRLSDA
jgi:hypothetical protein